MWPSRTSWHNQLLHDFVRFILAVMCLDKELLGLHASQWAVDTVGRKSVERWRLTACAGMGKVIWAVRVAEIEEELLVKDSWRDESDAPEFRNLEYTQVPEVVQTVSYEAEYGEIQDSDVLYYKPAKERSNFDQEYKVGNLIFSRIFLERNGNDLFDFQLEHQSLCALRCYYW